MSTAQQALYASMKEDDFLGFVVTFAGYNRWLVYHTHNSQHSAAGFPDLVLVRGPRLIFAECKTEKGKVTAAQQKWLDGLRATAQQRDDRPYPTPEVYLWRPSMTDEIMALLK